MYFFFSLASRDSHVRLSRMQNKKPTIDTLVGQIVSKIVDTPSKHNKIEEKDGKKTGVNELKKKDTEKSKKASRSDTLTGIVGFRARNRI